MQNIGCMAIIQFVAAQSFLNFTQGTINHDLGKISKRFHDCNKCYRKYDFDRSEFEMNFGQENVIKCIHFPRYLPFVRAINRSLVNFPHKGQWRGALMFSLICAWIKGSANNRDAGDLFIMAYWRHFCLQKVSHLFPDPMYHKVFLPLPLCVCGPSFAVVDDCAE